MSRIIAIIYKLHPEDVAKCQAKWMAAGESRESVMSKPVQSYGTKKCTSSQYSACASLSHLASLFLSMHMFVLSLAVFLATQCCTTRKHVRCNGWISASTRFALAQQAILLVLASWHTFSEPELSSIADLSSVAVSQQRAAVHSTRSRRGR